MKSFTSILIPFVAFLGSVQPAQAEDACLDVGGLALAEALDETSLVAAIAGDFTSASARIVGEHETTTGLVLDMQHHFLSDRNGLLKTQDKAVLTRVSGKESTYMLEIEYNIVNATGVFEGYRGTFRSYGLFKHNEGEVVLRYEGEICR